MGFSSFDFTLHIKLKTCNGHFKKISKIWANAEWMEQVGKNN
jgi:hypothetical protein